MVMHVLRLTSTWFDDGLVLGGGGATCQQLVMYAAVGARVYRVSTHGWMDGYVVGWAMGWATVSVDMSVHRCRRSSDEPLLDSIWTQD